MATIDVHLQDDLKAFLDQEASKGGFESTGDYVRAVLTTIWRATNKEAIEAELIRRIDGPPAIELPNGFWDDMKARLRRNRAH